MITGEDVQKQMEKEVFGDEDGKAQHARLGVDARSIYALLMGHPHIDPVVLIGGICMGLEFAANGKAHDPETNGSSDEFLEQVSRDKLIESIEPEVQDFA